MALKKRNHKKVSLQKKKELSFPNSPFSPPLKKLKPAFCRTPSDWTGISPVRRIVFNKKSSSGIYINYVFFKPKSRAAPSRFLSVWASCINREAHLIPPLQIYVLIDNYILFYCGNILYLTPRLTNFRMKYMVVNKWSQDDGRISRKYPPRSHSPCTDLVWERLQIDMLHCGQI